VAPHASAGWLLSAFSCPQVDSQEAPLDAAADAEAQYRQWLGRQYGAYVNQMLALVTGAQLPAAGGGEAAAAAARGPGGEAPVAKKAPLQRTAGVQVVAAAALMECARSELGPGGFSGRLYGRLLSGVLTGQGVRPEVFALLFNKYLAMAGERRAGRVGGRRCPRTNPKTAAVGKRSRDRRLRVRAYPTHDRMQGNGGGRGPRSDAPLQARVDDLECTPWCGPGADLV
jgi:hypothetical protein